MKLNIFKRNKEIESESKAELITLTFKMPLINFINYFKKNHNWEVRFSDKELDMIDKAIKQIRKGNPQDLIFGDENKK